jgi:hypothetical protein
MSSGTPKRSPQGKAAGKFCQKECSVLGKKIKEEIAESGTPRRIGKNARVLSRTSPSRLQRSLAIREGVQNKTEEDPLDAYLQKGDSRPRCDQKIEQLIAGAACLAESCCPRLAERIAGGSNDADAQFEVMRKENVKPSRRETCRSQNHCGEFACQRGQSYQFGANLANHPNCRINKLFRINGLRTNESLFLRHISWLFSII